ncbi:MAG: endolytic transglycosylase MltG [Bacteroidota bacterium]|nr:endolytic transglycosylase MltG [Bacteroidota bacterium]
MNVRNLSKKFWLKISGGILGALLIASYVIFFRSTSFEASPQIITINKGESFSAFAETLQSRGIIRSVFTFKLSGKILGSTHKMHVGKYSFTSAVSNYEILKDIESGLATVNSKITIYEGLRATQIAKILRREIGIDTAKFFQLFHDPSLIGIQPNNAQSLEGYLMPETYEFPWQDDEETVVKSMLAQFQEFFVDSLQQRMKEMGLSLNDVMTMASIVEGEAVVDSERPIIAGVYYNRLRIHMPLQADPTVQYIVGDTPRRLSYNDLKIESAYNTYMRLGLPPGPINNPGKKSILAALYPANHKFLYFVSAANGHHRFARSYVEHLRNVRLYRRVRAAQNG